MSKPSIDDVIRTAQGLGDLADASEAVLDRLATVAGVARRLKTARRKAANSGPVLRMFWQAVADRRQERLDRLKSGLAGMPVG